jgi:hypothetical protein
MVRLRTLRSVVVSGVVLFIGCGGEQARESAREQQQPVVQQYAADAARAEVVINVLYGGASVRGERIRMNADPRCASLHGHDVYPQRVSVDAQGRLENAFVYVKEGLKGQRFPSPTEAVVLDQKGCMYEPRVLGLRVNQTLQIKNSDPTLHNVNAAARVNRGFNIAQPAQGMQTERKFDRAEVMIPFKCDVHPWMSSYVGVVDHPFFGVSGAEGIVALKELPPGEYVIVAWHEQLGTVEERVSVEPGESKQVQLKFSATAL